MTAVNEPQNVYGCLTARTVKCLRLSAESGSNRKVFTVRGQANRKRFWANRKRFWANRKLFYGLFTARPSFTVLETLDC